MGFVVDVRSEFWVTRELDLSFLTRSVKKEVGVLIGVLSREEGGTCLGE